MPAKRSATKDEPKYEPLHADTSLLALDVSSSAIGLARFTCGKFREADLIRSPMGWDSIRRLRANAEQLREYLCDHTVGREYINRVVIEWQSPYKAARNPNAIGLSTLGQSQGYVLCLLDHFGIPVDTVSERVWTRQLGWPASKKTRAAQVRLLCPEYAAVIAANPKADPGLDMADAIGLAFWRLSFK